MTQSGPDKYRLRFDTSMRNTDYTLLLMNVARACMVSKSFFVRSEAISCSLKVFSMKTRISTNPSESIPLLLAALVAAVSWNLFTWWRAIPSSSSHALIGGLVGAGVAKVGTGSLVASGLIKTIVFIVLAPMMGFVLGALLMLIVSWLFFRTTTRRVDTWFRRLQLVSAALYSLGHGGNDAQKTAGIIWLLLIAGGYSTTQSNVPRRESTTRRSRRAPSASSWPSGVIRSTEPVRCSRTPQRRDAHSGRRSATRSTSASGVLA